MIVKSALSEDESNKRLFFLSSRHEKGKSTESILMSTEIENLIRTSTVIVWRKSLSGSFSGRFL